METEGKSEQRHLWHANQDTADMIIDLRNRSFYGDYIKYGFCPGYNPFKERILELLNTNPVYLILEEGCRSAIFRSGKMETGPVT